MYPFGEQKGAAGVGPYGGIPYLPENSSARCSVKRARVKDLLRVLWSLGFWLPDWDPDSSASPEADPSASAWLCCCSFFSMAALILHTPDGQD